MAGVCVFTDAWRRSQKPRWRVEARAAAFDHQILRPSKSVKAVMAARVHEHDLEVKNLRWRVVIFRS